MFKNDEFLDAQKKPENSLTAEIASDLCPCPSSGYFHNCFGTWNDGTGYKYVGEWKNNEQHGQGTSTWSAPLSNAGEKYVGEWKNHKQNGQGKSTYSMPHSSAGYKYVGSLETAKSTDKVPQLGPNQAVLRETNMLVSLGMIKFTD